MGAPNLVLGGSHSGNVSAMELGRAGVLDIVSSDYVPSSIIQGVFKLWQAGAKKTLPEAVATVSRTPAQIASLSDRGEITWSESRSYPGDDGQGHTGRRQCLACRRAHHLEERHATDRPAVQTLEVEGGARYGMEAINQLEHALQSALQAEQEDAAPALITAALLHDIGHLVHKLGIAAERGIDDRHEVLGENCCASWFDDDVVLPVCCMDAKSSICVEWSLVISIHFLRHPCVACSFRADRLAKGKLTNLFVIRVVRPRSGCDDGMRTQKSKTW